jgi:hypothetical protein
MTIQITSSVPLHQTPVSKQYRNEAPPEGPLQLRPQDGGAPIPAQADRYLKVIDALLTMPAGTARFELESAPQHESNVTLHEEDSRLRIELPSGPFGVYHYEESAPRPYIWPLYGPGGVEMTRAFPMEDRAGEKQDHPHHRSLWSAFDEVNGVNNWHDGEGHGWTRHEHVVVNSGPVFGRFAAKSVWTSAEDEPILEEMRHVRVYNVDGDSRLFDYTIFWRAMYGDVTFGDTKEAGAIAVRVATSMDGERGGVITNSEGGRGEKECWGKRADWCDYTGDIGGERFGIAIFNRPNRQSFSGAPRWHVRDYGLFATNPFSVAAFEGGEKQPFILKSEKVVTFSYRVLLHKDDATDDIKQVWDAIANRPQVTEE